jgi:death on curing protein
MSNEPKWIRIDVVRTLHQMQLAEHGGKDGIVSEGSLDASVASPKHLFFYGDPQPDISSLAAQYAYSITRNHPFCDGNKRVAAVVCELFLELNGFELTASDQEAYLMYMRLANGEMEAEQFSQWIRSNLRPAT